MRRVANADAAHDVDRLFIIAHFEKFEMRNVPELFAKGLLASNVVASNNIKFGLQGSGSGHGHEAAEDRRFFKRDMKFSMEAN